MNSLTTVGKQRKYNIPTSILFFLVMRFFDNVQSPITFGAKKFNGARKKKVAKK